MAPRPLDIRLSIAPSMLVRIRRDDDGMWRCAHIDVHDLGDFMLRIDRWLGPDGAEIDQGSYMTMPTPLLERIQRLTWIRRGGPPATTGGTP